MNTPAWTEEQELDERARAESEGPALALDTAERNLEREE